MCSSRSRAAREREEKQKEEEAAKEAAESSSEQPQQQPFVAPGDNNLMQYIEDVTEKVAPLPTTRDQVIALAQ